MKDEFYFDRVDYSDVAAALLAALSYRTKKQEFQTSG
jgi:hypothetical protein